MRRSWQWLLVGLLGVMLGLSSPAQASDLAPFAPPEETATPATYTPIAPAAPASPAPASEWNEIERLPPVRPAPPFEPVDAQPDQDDGARPIGKANHRLMGNSGICSVVGLVGATYTYSPVPELQLELGAGIGFSGFQFSFMPKASVGNAHHRFVLGLGPSVGIDRDNNPAYTYVAYWLNGEVGYEFRSVGGFSFLIAGGFFKGIGGEYREQCVIDCEGDTRGWPEPATRIPLFPQGRIAFGRWF